ncbi:M16 family metallopeptidase [Chondromyces apiculatus]|uniref:Peptidase, M16 (Pitrilysin) family n=1 Tax=Chondromyces apiculatus DSM 436 TaxID=1192034 RepID=A0A017SVN4_9BACT|nr:pitrilysin family protein [Chondromyces apiculatus]EYF00837.1 peptidase, M16 (pitrilysin) family [Chondromyces apiculatus DSM 436]
MSAAPPSMSIEPATLQHVDVTLPNGLPVVLVPQPGVHRAVATLYLRAGSRFETEHTNGLSHFLEHMVFRGTTTLPTAHAQALAFERLGGTLYAATHVDHGVMSVSVPPVSLGAVLDLLGEVTTSPRFTSIEVERGIVREEILEDLDEDGRDIDADNNVRALMYEQHPLGYTITGKSEAIDRFDEAMLRTHHARHYTAANAVLCVAGRIGDPEALMKRIEQSFGAMPRGTAVPAAPPPFSQKKARFKFLENQSSQTDLRVAFRGVSERDAIEPAVEMLLRVLDDGMSTRLYERICDRLGLCYDVSGMFEAYEDDGVVDIAAGVQHDRATLVVKEIFALLHELSDQGPREEELEKARDRHLWSVEAMRDDAESTAGFYGLTRLAGVARTPEARHAQLAAVTVGDVQAAARAIFRPERLSVVAVGLLRSSEEARLEKVVRNFGG